MQLLKSKWLIVLCLMMMSSIAYAQDDHLLEDEGDIIIQYFPMGHRCTFGSETFQCFTLNEYKTLLQMDNDLAHFKQELETLKVTLYNLEQANKHLRLSVVSLTEQVDTLQTERQRLLTMWTEENRLRLAAENRPMIGSPIAWGLAGVEAAVILGLVISMLVGSTGGN